MHTEFSPAWLGSLPICAKFTTSYCELKTTRNIPLPGTAPGFICRVLFTLNGGHVEDVRALDRLLLGCHWYQKQSRAWVERNGQRQPGGACDGG